MNLTSNSSRLFERSAMMFYLELSPYWAWIELPNTMMRRGWQMFLQYERSRAYDCLEFLSRLYPHSRIGLVMSQIIWVWISGDTVSRTHLHLTAVMPPLALHVTTTILLTYASMTKFVSWDRDRLQSRYIKVIFIIIDQLWMVGWDILCIHQSICVYYS